MRAGSYPPIGDYALIRDCHSAALLSWDGSVDWCCFHRFDGRPVRAPARLGKGSGRSNCGRRHFVSSKVMAWVTADRAVSLARTRGDDAGMDRSANLRDAIQTTIEANGVSVPNRGGDSARSLN
jgi:GH15 family glucan-1,4-alpha-glucosidase